MSLTSTYRLQLHAGFGFADAARITAHLHALGVSHAYASPYLAAESGSTHGYNLTDPRRLNPEIGDDAAFTAWTRGLAERGMGHIVDVVPNHMSASTANAWWADVLENGPSSIYGGHFDIEWHPPKDALENKVLLPVLGAQYGEVLEKGELTVEREGGSFFVRYWERRLPVNPSSLVPLLERALASFAVPPEDPRRQELESILTGLRHLPPPSETDPERQRERHREKEVLKRRLEALCEDEAARDAVDGAVTATNGKPGDPRSFDDLDRLLVDQCYRLAFWRVATEEINYRRFFDINDLAAIRMELDAVFDESLDLLLRFVEDGRLDGIRLDHTDGLYDPQGFFEKLRRAAEERGRRDLYVVVEKILAHGEVLPRAWPIDGTTGYDFLVQASGVFVDARSEAAFTRLWADVSGDARPFGAHVADAKRTIMRASLSSEVHMLAIRLERIAMKDRRSRDFTYAALRRAITETVTAFPVYRTYVRPDGSREATDEQILARAIRLAKRRNPEVSPSVFDFLRDVLLLAPSEGDDRDARVEVSMRFQQLTGPVMAKGVEDTAFYTYLRFAASNEVGGHPERFGTSTAELHAANAARAASFPHAMIATSTHDTKRGEDVRMRLAVLSELPEAWEDWVRGWLAQSQPLQTELDDERGPSEPDRYLLFQTLLGAWPLASEPDAAFGERIVAYAVKAAREAKQRTSWLSTNEPYEEALRTFVLGVLAEPTLSRSLGARARSIARHGASNGLALAVLKAASPGIPDTYQGSETWDLRLVDPDNRAPVDYEALARLGERARAADPTELLETFEDGAIKLRVLGACLRARRERPDLLVSGSYVPLDAPDEAVAFARRDDRDEALCLVTRLPVRATRGRAPWAIGNVWGDCAVAVRDGRFRDVVTGRALTVTDGRLALRDAFAVLPVSLLLRT